MVLFLALVVIVLLLLLGIKWRQNKRQRVLTRQLYSWAAQPDGLNPALQQWLNTLSAAEADLLVQLLQGYCASLNWELDWLFAPQIEKAPVLKEAIAESVRAYARAILTSLQMETDVDAYQAYLAFSRKPTSRKQSTLVQKLYLKLNEANISPPLETVKRRFFRKSVTRKEKIAAIQQSFSQQPARTMEVLKELLVEDATTSFSALRPQPSIAAVATT